MDLVDASWDPRPALAEDRVALLGLLGALDADEWARPTEAGHWTVKDVALHVLDDDLGLLARDRDGDRSGWLDPPGGLRGLVAALDARNEAWVEAAGGLSPRLVVDLLTWTGDQAGAHLAAAGLDGEGLVAWASDEPVPRWFDLARELTERWSHQQHLRDALGRPGDHDHRLPAVLGTFVWAYPHQLPPPAAGDATVLDLDLRPAGRWHLRAASGAWQLDAGEPPGAPDATLAAPPIDAWRLLTGLPVGDAVEATGPAALTGPLLAVRGILV